VPATHQQLRKLKSVLTIDSTIVAAYFFAIFIAGYLISRRHAHRSADEFITGGKTQAWWQTGLALLGMAVDPGYMSIAALGFIFGLYVTQWTAVHVWFTTWFAAMFFLPIYWRSRIVTTPEFLEKRFNVQCRVAFSLLMVVLLVATLGLGLYLGGLLLHNLIGWNLWISVAFIATVAGFYVILGGMRTVLVLDVYQAIFLFLTLLAVGTVAVWHIGGLSGLASIEATGQAGGRIPSIVPPSDWDMTNQNAFFPAQAIVAWATIAGLSWLACNFGMAQRILAAKSERDAQKSLLFLGILAAIVPTCSFLVGAAMREVDPNVKPDEAFLRVMLDWFPVGIRGLLAAGMMAALLSTADGLLTGTGALLLQDVYVRFFRPRAGEAEQKRFTRVTEVIGLLIGVALVAVFRKEQSAMARLQSIYADVLGVIVAIYIVGMFSRRAAPRGAFVGMIVGIALAAAMELLPRLNPSLTLNFAYVGFFSFVGTIMVTMLLSFFENPVAVERLKNLTIHTLEDVKGPWVGLKAWPGLWKWALLMAAAWFGASAAWEWYVRSRHV
jgi:SSS family solute:Na+ symporter